MSVPDNFLLTFFTVAITRLLDIDETTLKRADNDDVGDTLLTDCRRCVLDQQYAILLETSETYGRKKQLQNNGSHSITISVNQVQERLSQLKHESNLSHGLKIAMEDMDDAARIAICKLILHAEDEQQQQQSCHDKGDGGEERTMKPSSSSSGRKLQDEGRLDRNKLMEYFGLCQASLKLDCVVKFMAGETTSLFERKSNDNNINNNDYKTAATVTTIMFPQSRHEYVQQLLAKSMGWDPGFVTSELRQIFVEKNKNSVDDDDDDGDEYYNKEVVLLFQQLVEKIMVAVRLASLRINKSQQDSKLLNDLDKGGNTRVVSVQYSEFEISSDGTKKKSKTNAPEQISQEERIDDESITEEEKKRQLRLASEAAMLQQTILGKLYNMDEHQRNNELKEAEEVSNEFMKQVMELSPGQERIDFLRRVDPVTSTQLAIHKLWNGVLKANDGKPPQTVAAPKTTGV
mmetsp:Transcript_60260/g.67406  ORF Transcript_60260/g.67406 Transcript_60260/m.67406 type:complete len:460 (+) Transcript_60260:144-1523(+)